VVVDRGVELFRRVYREAAVTVVAVAGGRQQDQTALLELPTQAVAVAVEVAILLLKL